MKLIFIRHAEPDYSIDSLTEKGFREAKILAERTKNWNVTQFYCSPLGRAQATAKPTLDAHHVTLTSHYPEEAPDKIIMPDPSKAIVYPWLREVYAPVDADFHPDHRSIPWDFTPKFLSDNPLLFDINRWQEVPLIANSDYKNQYDWISGRLDALLSLYGYHREGFYYQTDGASAPTNAYMNYDGHTIEYMKNTDQNETVVVIFCHLGVMMTMISHLLNTTPFVLYHGVFVPPASVTVLSAEERIPGQAYFRAQMIGDTSHFRIAGEPVSFYGAFAAPFQM